MYCSNCGFDNGDSKFCKKCGTKLVNEVPAEENVQNTAEPVYDAFSTEEPIIQQAESFNDSFNSTANTVNQNLKPKKSVNIIGIAIAAVIVLGAIGVFGKDAIIKAVSPKAYVGTAFTETLDEITTELNTLQENLLGFKLDNDSDFSTGVSAALDSISISDAPSYVEDKLKALKNYKLNADVSVNSSKNEMQGKFGLLYKDKDLVNANMYWNDENIGFTVPQIFDEYITVPSKTFGEKWNQSYLGREADVVIDNALDLSFSNLMDASNGKDVLDAKTEKELKNQVKQLVKNSTVTKMGKANLTVNNKNVNTSAFQIGLSDIAIKNFLSQSVKALAEDDYIRSNMKYVLSAADENYDEIIYDLLDEIDEMYIDPVVNFSVAVYKGKIVCIIYSNNGYAVPGMLTGEGVAFYLQDTKNLINNVKMVIADSNDLEITITAIGNHTMAGGQFTSELKLVGEEDGDRSGITYNLSIDSKANTLVGSCDYFDMQSQDESIKVSYNGSFDNKNGLKISLTNISVKDDYNSFKASGLLEMRITKGASDIIGDRTNSVNILDFDKNKLEDYFGGAKIQRNVMDLFKQPGFETLEDLF